ncbi:MAG TPA: TldD/PmbA family protein [Candidatus Baltobacteraceae bacterium]|nr:TldD/PmbA family protein [Candidatus Baltobacteraceae bacterium]
MDKAAREALAARVLKLSTADQTEVAIYSSNSGLTRFTHNAVHQNVAESDTAIKIRAIVGRRTGVAATNMLDDAALKGAVERAIAMAHLAPEDPALAQLPAGGPTVAPPGAFDQTTASATPQKRAEMCDAIFRVAEKNDYWCAGFATTSESSVTIANSNGAMASFTGTDAGVNVKMNASDSSGFAECYVNDCSEIDAHSIGERAAEKTRTSASPQTVEPGEWTVILEPAAFGELFTYIGDHFSAQAYDEGSSFLSDGLDRKYFGENVTLYDDYAHPLAPGMPFDYEGQPTRRLTLVENGVAKNVVTDSYWAKKLQRENTGHALPAPNAYGPQALHLVVAGGTKSLDQLIAETPRGLLISRFWYIRTVDQKKAIVTGMTRDGTFLIRDGKLAGGVRNMRFNQSIIDCLNACELSREQARTGSYSYSIVVPSAKISGFTFSSGTDF